MKIREIELGGVWSIGNYENIKLAIRFSVESESDLAIVSEILSKLSKIAWALRRINDRYDDNLETINSLAKRLDHYKKQKEECITEFKQRVNEIIEKYKDVLKTEVVEEITKAVENNEFSICIEKLAHIAECERLPNCKYYIEQYENAINKINSLNEENNKLQELKNKIHEALKNNDIETAYKLAIDYLATKKNEEW